jgi:hypothetical protein
LTPAPLERIVRERTGDRCESSPPPAFILPASLVEPILAHRQGVNAAKSLGELDVGDQDFLDGSHEMPV